MKKNQETNQDVNVNAIATFSVAKIAKENEICPKRARARLRKHFAGTLQKNGLGLSSWIFPVDRQEEILSIMRGNAKKTEEETENAESES